MVKMLPGINQKVRDNVGFSLSEAEGGADLRSDSQDERKPDCHNGVKRTREEVLGEESLKVAKIPEEEDDEDCGDWGEEIHKQFVEAIFEIGLRNSSPAVILESMTQKPKSITSERVKSKLQKYRNNKDKSKQEFIEEYEGFLQRAKAIDTAGGVARRPSPTALLEMMGSTKLLGGEAAAYLSYAVMKERESNNPGEGDGNVISTQLLRKGALEYVENFAGSPIPFPELTEAEKKSSLGVSMTFVMGLFLSMTQHLRKERSKAESLMEDQVDTFQRKHARAKSPEDGSKSLFSLASPDQAALQGDNSAQNFYLTKDDAQNVTPDITNPPVPYLL